MRVYVPATWPMLRKMVDSGLLEPIGGTAFALTPKLRESYTSGDDEELEYAAMLEAARASLRLLAVEFGLGEDGVPARRVVVAADLDDVTLRPDLDDGAVRLPARCRWRRWPRCTSTTPTPSTRSPRPPGRWTPPTWATWTPSS